MIEKIEEETQQGVTDLSDDEISKVRNTVMHPVEKKEDIKENINEDKKELTDNVSKIEIPKIEKQLVEELKKLKDNKSKDEKDIIDKLYDELKTSHSEIERMGKEFEERFTKIKMEMTEQEKELQVKDNIAKKANEEVKVKEEIVKIKDAKLDDMNKRLQIIEDERTKKSEEVKFVVVSNMVDKYEKLGLVNDDNRDSKIDELRTMSDVALEELGNVLTKKLEQEPDAPLPSSEEIKSMSVKTDKIAIPVDDLDVLFNKFKSAK